MKLVVLEPLGVDEEKLKNIANEVLGNSFDITFYKDRKENSETLINRSKDADAVILSNFPFKKEVLKNLKNLKMISVAFTGVDHIDMAYTRENNIFVSNSAGYASGAVTELVFGLIISLYRKIHACDKATRRGETKDGLVGNEMAGKKFGIIGAGDIGMNVAKVAKSFGCNVFLSEYSKNKVAGMEYLSLTEILKTCDIVSLHLPLLESTRGLIGKEELKLMKQSSILINTARGAVVDSSALADALNNDVIAGAGIDVFDVEPPLSLDEPLLSAKNTILTPHVAFATKESMIKRAYIAFENVKKWAEGNPVNVIK